MNRVEFTREIVGLFQEMIDDGEHPIGDFWKRSDEEQKRLFDAGLSKCDGIIIISKHQRGCGLDIYFIENGKLVDPKRGWEYWHKRWEARGGSPMIEWDKGHFEG